MKVSTRGRYALRLMIDLAQHNDDGYISLKEISARQDITVRYLEQIIAILLKAGFVQSFRGKSGGYRLSRHPREYTTEDILKLTEGSLLPLSCTASQNSPCPRASSCATLPFWRGLQKVIEDYLGRVTLETPAEFEAWRAAGLAEDAKRQAKKDARAKAKGKGSGVREPAPDSDAD